MDLIHNFQKKIIAYIGFTMMHEQRGNYPGYMILEEKNTCFSLFEVLGLIMCEKGSCFVHWSTP